MTNKSIGAWKKYEKNLENMIQELKNDKKFNNYFSFIIY